MGGDNYRGAEKVYAWSFYTQGASEGAQASADQFLQESLAWFGDADPTLGSGIEKGCRLAGLVNRQRTLLILDGLEPQQYPPARLSGADTGTPAPRHGQEGKLKDDGMAYFLKGLATGPGAAITDG